jgi:hypothetical protein
MLRSQIETGSTYLARVSGKVVPLKILRKLPTGGWRALNMLSGRKIRVKSGRRLLGVCADSTARAIEQAERLIADPGQPIEMDKELIRLFGRIF